MSEPGGGPRQPLPEQVSPLQVDLLLAEIRAQLAEDWETPADARESVRLIEETLGHAAETIGALVDSHNALIARALDLYNVDFPLAVLANVAPDMIGKWAAQILNVAGQFLWHELFRPE